MSNIQERLDRCFTAIFPELSPAEIRRASPASVAAWDSLATITIVSVIEEEFGIEIAPDQLEDMGSYELILDCLERVLPQ